MEACVDTWDVIKTEWTSFALSKEEEDLLFQVVDTLRQRDPEEADLVLRRFDDLREYGKAITRFPSVTLSQVIQGKERNEQTLVSSLCHISHRTGFLHTPTRVVASRSFLVAKSHAFSLLALVCGDNPPLLREIRHVIFSTACALMAEDVYLSCLEDPDFPVEVKEQLAADLVHLWDRGIDPRASQHVPALEALWFVRNENCPSFGTMDGSSELFRLSLELGSDWQDFLLHNLADSQVQSALEEFVFGLSYEEIEEIRRILAHRGILAINTEELRVFLGKRNSYSEIIPEDPRSLYDFYVERKEAARFRCRSKQAGPWKTIEEMYLIYRFSK